LWKKIDEVGFKRFDLGIPPMLVPVVHGDYLQPKRLACRIVMMGPITFGVYMNGGITAGQTLHFLAGKLSDRRERSRGQITPRNARETVAR